MAECDWIIVCDHAFYAVPGKLCLIGIFDVIFAQAMPARHARAWIGLNVIGQPGEEVVQRLQIIGPNGRSLFEPNIQRYTLPNSGSAQLAVDLQGLGFEQFGRHAIEVDLGSGEHKSAWFTVLQLPAQNQT